MSGLFALVFLCSVPAFVMGLIFPKLVMPWDKQATRKKSAKLYLAAMISSFVLFGMTAPQSSQPDSNLSTTAGENPNTGLPSKIIGGM